MERSNFSKANSEIGKKSEKKVNKKKTGTTGSVDQDGAWLKREKFIFTDPVNRRIEMCQLSEIMIERAVYHSELRSLLGIDERIVSLSDEIVGYVRRKEEENSKLYTVAEFTKIVRGCMSIRMRTWYRILKNFNPRIDDDYPETIVEYDDDGKIVDYGYSRRNWSPFYYHFNPYKYNPEEILLAKEEAGHIDHALLEMSKRHSKVNRIDFEINARALNLEDLITGESVLPGLSKTDMAVRRHHAKNKMKKIVAGYCPVVKEKQEQADGMEKIIDLADDLKKNNKNKEESISKSEDPNFEKAA